MFVAMKPFLSGVCLSNARVKSQSRHPLTLNSGNCFKYGHECSLSETHPFEIDIKSPNHFATPEPETSTAPTVVQKPQMSQQSQYPQYPQYPQYSQYVQQPQQSQYSEYPQHTQNYEASYGYAIPDDHYHSPLQSYLTPEAVSP